MKNNETTVVISSSNVIEYVVISYTYFKKSGNVTATLFFSNKPDTITKKCRGGGYDKELAALQLMDLKRFGHLTNASEIYKVFHTAGYIVIVVRSYR